MDSRSHFPAGCVAAVAADKAGVGLAAIDRLVRLRRRHGRPTIDLGVRDRHHPLVRDPDLLWTLVMSDDHVLEATAQVVTETGVAFWQAWARAVTHGLAEDWRYEAGGPVAGVPPYFRMSDLDEDFELIAEITSQPLEHPPT